VSPPASLADLTAHELAERFAGGEATSVQATEAALERIAATDELLRAFLTVTGDQASRALVAGGGVRWRQRLAGRVVVEAW
jgi:Asp-tRNA(Asn)/Glu-tRNA(Gln) amidotransferase A subunit family amidase